MDATGIDVLPRRYWVKTPGYSALVEVPPEQDDLAARLLKVFKTIPALPSTSPPAVFDENLMTVYPLFDVHFGLKAIAQVSGEDYDLGIAAARLKRGMSACMSTARRGVIINGGDFTHADDDLNVTPANKHPLDSAARNYVVLDAAVECIVALIDMALTQHEIVDYISVPGNHDPKNWVTLMFALAARYRDNPRVRIEKSPAEFSVITHGQTMVAVHHGHKRKPEDLVLWFAAEFPDVWAGSRYRTLLTGHFHHKASKSMPGVHWEQIPPITVRDHYAYSSAYAAIAEFTAITYDLRGEVFRKREPL